MDSDWMRFHNRILCRFASIVQGDSWMLPRMLSKMSSQVEEDVC